MKLNDAKFPDSKQWHKYNTIAQWHVRTKYIGKNSMAGTKNNNATIHHEYNGTTQLTNNEHKIMAQHDCAIQWHNVLALNSFALIIQIKGNTIAQK